MQQKIVGKMNSETLVITFQRPTSIFCAFCHVQRIFLFPPVNDHHCYDYHSHYTTDMYFDISYRRIDYTDPDTVLDEKSGPADGHLHLGRFIHGSLDPLWRGHETQGGRAGTAAAGGSCGGTEARDASEKGTIPAVVPRLFCIDPDAGKILSNRQSLTRKHRHRGKTSAAVPSLSFRTVCSCSLCTVMALEVPRKLNETSGFSSPARHRHLRLESVLHRSREKISPNRHSGIHSLQESFAGYCPSVS